MKSDAFGARGRLETASGPLTVYRLSALEQRGLAQGLDRMPFSIKVLLEAVLRNLDGELVTSQDVENLARWNAPAPMDVELPYLPARVLLQDFPGVPAVVALASMRAAVTAGDPKRINPLVPVDLVIDHRQVDYWLTTRSARTPRSIECNRESMSSCVGDSGPCLQESSSIVHQVNLSSWPRALTKQRMARRLLDSWWHRLHTTMINGLVSWLGRKDRG